MCEVPVRCAKFIVRKQWIVAGTDDMHLRVYNYNTMEKVKAWEAHTDYIRYVEIHPNRPYIIRLVSTIINQQTNFNCNCMMPYVNGILFMMRCRMVISLQRLDEFH